VSTMVSPSEEEGAAKSFTLRQRLALGAISRLGCLLIGLIGRTLRFEWSTEPGGVGSDGEPPHGVGVFWHCAVIPATWRFRDYHIAVMTSRSFDGEYIARIIEHFGFGTVRGSSSRGGSGALIGVNRVLAGGNTVAFTIDGPRGPRFVAKPGPVLLARMSGTPIICFYLACERAWILPSWDKMMIPKPFSRVHLRWAELIWVPSETGDEEMKVLHQRMQEALERVRRDAVAALGPGAS